MPRAGRLFLCATLAAATLAISACNAPPAPVTATAVTKDVGARPFIFGSVKVISPKAPAAWTPTDCTTDPFYWRCPDGFRLVFLRPNDPTPIEYRLTGDGSFKIPLDPGDYFLAEWNWHQADMSTVDEKIAGAIGAAFHVDPAAKATYVGDLQVVFSGVRYAFRLDDRFEQASASLTSSYSQLAGNVSKSLLEMKRPPAGARQFSICDPSWGAHCDNTLAGVEPVQPAQSGASFPAVASVTPTLEWKKVGADDVTYDVAIYEALPYGPPPARALCPGTPDRVRAGSDRAELHRQDTAQAARPLFLDRPAPEGRDGVRLVVDELSGVRFPHRRLHIRARVERALPLRDAIDQWRLHLLRQQPFRLSIEAAFWKTHRRS